MLGLPRTTGHLLALLALLAAAPAQADEAEDLPGSLTAAAPVEAMIAAPASAAPASAVAGEALASAAPASAAPGAAPAPQAISPGRRALAATGAVIPGLVVHGTGHLLLGEKRTGLSLMALGGAGTGLVVGGLGGAAVSGASRRVIAPIVLTTVAGAGLFGISLLADLYGVLAPEGGTGSPVAVLPWVETQLGVAYVHDPTFAYRSFLVPGMDLRLRSLRLSGSGWFALNDDNARLRGEAAYRFLGPGTPDGPRAADGSFLELEAAITHHRYTSDGFSITTGEVTLQGRLDLAHIGPTLRGSFAEMGWGIGLEAYRYGRRPIEGNEILTPHFAFGMYLGHEGYPRGEAKVVYEHRHDGYAAGAKITGLGSGVPGHLGLQGRLYASPRWGLLADVQAGSAYVGRLSLLLRPGGSP
ncbi:hypothetical protein [Sorangium sp. So ce513]|uniref:hypothetical protein n=1 Tax=Sorangium sp. So ce513 TaxID=3133315 RepID=UPI003F60F927